MNARSGTKPVIFITGTDTGVGKTLLTSLLLRHLRRNRCHALAMKPFCSGNREDVCRLHPIQDGELSLDEINPYFFAAPLAPWVAARKQRRSIPLREVLRGIDQVARRCERLLIEGAGGLLAPLGEDYTVADLIAERNGEVIVVAPNRLGMINHTLLTVRALQQIGVSQLKVVVMSGREPDPSSPSNPRVLAELLGRVPVFRLGFLGPEPIGIEAVKTIEKKVNKTLARILA